MKYALPLLTAGFGLAAAEDLVLPQPPGPYVVAMTSEELVDARRLDPFNTSHPRRVMISRFTPVPRQKCPSNGRVEYMPALISELEDAIGTEFLGNSSWPSGVLSRVKLDLCRNAPPSLLDHAYHSFPTILFDTGLNTTRLFYSATAQHLASRGYNVIVVDHPYETDVVIFPDGSIIYGGRVNRTSDEAALVRALEVRANDASFVLDALGLELHGGGPNSVKVGFAGHSFGGAATAVAMLNDTRVVAGVNLDGRMFGPVLQAGFGGPGANQSFLIVGSEGHNSSNEPSWESLWQAVRLHPPRWIKELSVNGSLHGSFWDLSLIGDVSGLRSNDQLVRDLFGEILGARIMEILREYLDDFFQMTLGDAGQGLLEGPNREYPEVEFLRSGV